MKLSLDLHDFSVLNNRLDLLLELKEHIPELKVSMFTIPLHVAKEMTTEGRLLRESELKKVKDNLDWIQIIPHGLTHMPYEFMKADRWTMKMTLEAIDEAFKKDGLPYEKGFCAPYWLWNQDVVDVLDENGWWGAIDRNQPEMLKTKKYYVYSHSIDEPFWTLGSDTLNLHGHIDLTSPNDIEACLLNLMKVPKGEWHFVTDFLKSD